MSNDSNFISSNNIGAQGGDLTADSLYSTDLTENPTWLNIHLFVALIATIITFLGTSFSFEGFLFVCFHFLSPSAISILLSVWHYMNNTQKGSLWWWMYVPFVFAMV
jgi:hypothetical protein